MELKLLTFDATDKKVEVSDELFDAPFNQSLIYQVIHGFMQQRKQGTKAQKTRGDVSGGGRKPRQQKRTGVSRAGSIRSPIWRGGGATFANKPHNKVHKVNRKMYRIAMRSIVSELCRSNALCITQEDELALAEPKTAKLDKWLKKLGLSQVLLVLEEPSQNLILSARNIPGVEVIDVKQLSPLDLVSYQQVVVGQKTLNGLQKRLSLC